MPQQLSIEYQPAFSHDVCKPLLYFLTVVSLLDLLMTLTTYIRYGNHTPLEFHLAPIFMVLMLATKIRLTENSKENYSYEVLLFNIPIVKRRFSGIVRASRGKLVTLLGKNREGYAKTFITEREPAASAIFGNFPQTAK